jgi:hypothetical protein
MCRSVLVSLVCVVCLGGPLQRARAAEDAPAATPVPSAVSAPAAATSLLVVYVDTDLREPGLAVAPGPDADLVDWKVPELGRLLRERVPLVLAANGMTGSAVTAKGQAEAVALAASEGPRPTLLLGIATFTKSSSGVFRKWGSVVLDVRLFDRAPSEAPRWQSRMGGGRLGFDPVFGVLKTARVDEGWVDDLLVMLLDRLAQQGLVKLTGPKATRPKT